MSDVLARESPLPISATFSKDARFWSGDPAWEPQEIVEGLGCRVLGRDGNWRIDYVAGLGAISLGYPDPSRDGTPANHWADAISRQAWQGAGFSLQHTSERLTAERIVSYLGSAVPGWSPDALSVRFGLSGSDACTMAVRLCRAATGRKRIISGGYHGCADWAVSVTPPAHGVTHPQYVDNWDSRDLDALDTMLRAEPAAAVIVEPPLDGRPAEWWHRLRAICTARDALLVLDEVVTGLRQGRGGVAGRVGMAPDIGVYGKAWGNGAPVSFMVFPRALASWFSRNDPCFVSSTHYGCALGFAALNAVLDSWSDGAIARIWRIGQMLRDGLHSVGWQTTGSAPTFLVNYGSDAERAYAVARFRDLGVMANRPWLVNLEHTEADVAQTVEAARTIYGELEAGAELPTQLPSVLFRGR